MKKFLVLLFTVLLSFTVIQIVSAQTSPPGVQTTNVLDLSTFAGIVACISLIVTQIAKVVPVISEKAILKILMSIAIGLGLTFFAWWLNLALFLENMLWWQVLIQGFLSGVGACGIYDFIKNIFKRE